MKKLLLKIAAAIFKFVKNKKFLFLKSMFR